MGGIMGRRFQDDKDVKYGGIMKQTRERRLNDKLFECLRNSGAAIEVPVSPNALLRLVREVSPSCP